MEDEFINDLNELAKRLHKSKTEILKEAFLLYKKRFSKHPLEKFAGKLKDSESFFRVIKDRNIKNKDIQL